jgi:hypothetical protein
MSVMGLAFYKIFFKGFFFGAVEKVMPGNACAKVNGARLK